MTDEHLKRIKSDAWESAFEEAHDQTNSRADRKRRDMQARIDNDPVIKYLNRVASYSPDAILTERIGRERQKRIELLDPWGCTRSTGDAP